ncbi:unnamed protein product [Moneuplotes crassus]|uniref:C2H2-type domain-containing protein n=1 Tax=Euplotes crassus TaxID=5936 RepID=A0AAD1U0U9_EUPCR|nr:unnamed protein product [Moneuplotes crassus]
MSFNTTINKLNGEKIPEEFVNLNEIWVPSHISTIQNLPPLNAVPCTLMPTGEEYFGVLEVREEPIPVYHSQPHLSQPKFPYQSLQMVQREEGMPSHIGVEGYSEEQHPSCLQNFSLCVNPNERKILSTPILSEPRSWNQRCQKAISPNLKAPFNSDDITSQNRRREGLSQPKTSRRSVIERDSCRCMKLDKNKTMTQMFNDKNMLISSSSNSSSVNQMQGASTKKAKKFGSSCLFCTCGMTKSQAHLVKRVLTPNNMRFLELLKNYEYEIAEEKSPLTGKPLPKYVCKYKGSCNKKFERTWKLLDHCRTHSGVRPYSCTICGRKFTQKGNRNKHMLKHE